MTHRRDTGNYICFPEANGYLRDQKIIRPGQTGGMMLLKVGADGAVPLSPICLDPVTISDYQPGQFQDSLTGSKRVMSFVLGPGYAWSQI